MAQQRLDHLLEAIHQAVLKAQTLMDEQHMEQLHKYFDEKGKPIMHELKVPTLDPEDDPEQMVTLRIPLLSLLPPTALRMKEMKMNFPVVLGRVQDEAEAMPTLRVDLGGSSGFFSKNQCVAQVEITFDADEPSEAFLRVNDYLVKSVV